MRRFQVYSRVLQRMEIELCLTFDKEPLSGRTTINVTDLMTITPEKYRVLQEAVPAITRSRELLNVKITEHIQDSAKHECEVLLRLLHTTLPRELRDIIYHYIHGEHQVGVTKLMGSTPNLGTSGVLDTAMTALLISGLQPRGYSHLLKAGTLPDEMLYEFAESWCSLCRFRFVASEDLRHFFSHNESGWDLSPRDHAKKIEFYSYIPPGGDIDLSLS
ncbi:hypothetical protein CC86DRAFT_39286 [Ophiobolus disseminans]|uniref:Uncharacterized protein n=1 Tax=Ophiobolus disseminans TaxID=1469910 RepID=A0A6A6ZW83_9PLEO|nr:hypothetical protein CC86DRAFT_39286 [Ophiobolus disseminans]